MPCPRVSKHDLPSLLLGHVLALSLSHRARRTCLKPLSGLTSDRAQAQAVVPLSVHKTHHFMILPLSKLCCHLSRPGVREQYGLRLHLHGGMYACML
jgi:hypothetical protein